jgi:protein-tyrosine-phosphatase
MTAFHIHFVCSGNIYRSRLAEAYLRSKQLPNLTVSSSGTQATIQHKGPIVWTALRLAYRNNLLPYLTNEWTQTEKDHLPNADMVIFMGKSNYEYCVSHFPLPKKFDVWDVPDFDDRELNGKPLNITREMECITLSESTFQEIKTHVDNLVSTLK